MRSSRQVAVLTRQLTRVWLSTPPQLSTTGCSVSSGPAVSMSSPSPTPSPQLPLLRPGYLTLSQGMATSSQPWSGESQQQEEQQQSSGGGSNGSGGPSEEAKRRARNFQIATGAACGFFGASYLLYWQLSVKAAEATVVKEGTASEDESGEGEAEEEKPRKKHVTLHDKHVIGYENRIRAYSTPDKIFRYFATLQILEGDGQAQIYMTPEDFLRSITPGWIQPEGLGLDQFLPKMTAEQWKVHPAHKKTDPNSIFSKLGNHGLISFSDYLFLLTLLATPSHHFEIAFKMFDLNGDGEVDVDEFEKVRDVVLNSTSVGHRHRDRSTTGNIAGSVGDALVEYFFGPNKDGKLTVEKFGEFHAQLLEEILRLEFNNMCPVNNRISEYDFAKSVLTFSSMNDQAKKKFLKRIRRKYGKGLSDCPDSMDGITFSDLRAFTQLLESVSDIEMALGMYMAAGASITAADLKTVSLAVAGVDLSDHLVEVVITLFDEDGDGNLSYKEFIKTMKSRTTRGLEKSKELGFARLVSSAMACSEKMAKEALGIKT